MSEPEGRVVQELERKRACEEPKPQRVTRTVFAQPCDKSNHTPNQTYTKKSHSIQTKHKVIAILLKLSNQEGEQNGKTQTTGL